MPAAVVVLGAATSPMAAADINRNVNNDRGTLRRFFKVSGGCIELGKKVLNINRWELFGIYHIWGEKKHGKLWNLGPSHGLKVGLATLRL